MNRYLIEINEQPYLIREYLTFWSYQKYGKIETPIKLVKCDYPKLKDIHKVIEANLIEDIELVTR